MPTYQFSNNASSLLAADIDDQVTTTSVQVQPGDGSKFPQPDATLGLQFPITLEDDTGAFEVCLCTARAGDVLTVVRGQEGTSAQNWTGANNTRVELRLTQAVLDNVVQKFTSYVAGGSGVRFNDSTGTTQAEVIARDDPASPGSLRLDLVGFGARTYLQSLVDLQVNAVSWPLATASRTEGYVLELDSTTDALVWMPRGARILDGTGTPTTRRVDVQYGEGLAVSDDGTKTIISSSPIIGEVRLFAFAAIPTNWRACDGSVLDAVANTALQPLYDVIGNVFGGSDNTDFQLPDLRGRAAIGTGTGVGLSSRTLADQVGAEMHQLTASEMPSHAHNQDQDTAGTAATGAAGLVDGGGVSNPNANSGIRPTGGDQPHNNMQPSLALAYAIYAGA